MAARRCTVKVTANFEANLEAIEVFLAEASSTPAFTALPGELADSIIPNLERFPEMGRLFLDRAAQSVEARQKIKQLEARVASLLPPPAFRFFPTPHPSLLSPSASHHQGTTARGF